MEDSIFTKIIKGEIQQEFIYQDDQCVVILTIEPINPGHMLVIPRQQVDTLWDIDDELYQHLESVAKRMAHVLHKAYPEYLRIGSVVEGFGVPHAHIHIFGYTEPLNPTIVRHAAERRIAESAELKEAADKLRANL